MFYDFYTNIERPDKDNYITSDLNKTIHDLHISSLTFVEIISKIAKSRWIEDEYIFGRYCSITYAYFHYLRSIITVNQCLDLIQTHPSTVVKGYVFAALLKLDSTKIFDLIVYSLKEYSSTVNVMKNESSKKYSLPDFFIAIGGKYLSKEQVLILSNKITKNNFKIEIPIT